MRINFYRARSGGDNVLGSGRPSVSERSHVKGQGQRSRVKVKGQGQIFGAAVDIRGSASPSEAKSKEELISPRSLSVCRIIAQMWSIGF